MLDSYNSSLLRLLRAPGVAAKDLGVRRKPLALRWAKWHTNTNLLALELKRLSTNNNPNLPGKGPLFSAAALRPDGRDRRHSGAQPSSEPLPYQFQNCAPIFENRFHPCKAPHLRKIDSSEAEACDKDVDAITQRLVIERIHRFSDGLGTVRAGPPNSYLTMSFVDAHLQRRVGHRKGNELLPVLRTGEPPGSFQLFVQGRRGQRGHQAKDRKPWRPRANFPQSPLGHTRRIVVHTKNEGRYCKNIAPG